MAKNCLQLNEHQIYNKMSNYQFHLGIDMGKIAFTYTVVNKEGKILLEGEVCNRPAEILTWIKLLSSTFSEVDFWSKTLLCLEHSGYYAFPLLNTLQEHVKTDIWLESALQIKRSIGVQRGKSDRIDAVRIATYSLDFQRKARLWKPTPRNIERLGLLISHRDRMVKYLMSLRNTLNEEIGFVNKDLHLEMAELSEGPLEALEKAVKEFDAEIEALLKSDETLARQTEIVKSLPGFGQVITSKLIQVTQGFTRLNTPRQLACFAGVAPFEHSSGTSLKGRTRVSHLANKDLKKMLHLAALVTIRKGNVMHAYFQRKVAQGKNKMSVINAIRNKLIHILLACVKNDTIYSKNYQHSLA